MATRAFIAHKGSIHCQKKVKIFGLNPEHAELNFNPILKMYGLNFVEENQLIFI